jgi:hypothetical protein
MSTAVESADDRVALLVLAESPVAVVQNRCDT